MPNEWQLAAEGKEVALEGLKAVAQELLISAGDLRVWLLEGEMGSGKTTLIKAIGEMMGVTETMSSPTFSIVNEYTVPDKKKIYHFDLYRLKNEREVMDIGAEEYFDSGELCLIEWPEKLGSLRPEQYFTVRISVLGPQHRKIEYQRS